MTQPLEYLPRAVLLFLGVCWPFTIISQAREEREGANQAAIAIASPRTAPMLGEHVGFHGYWFGIPVGSGWIELKEITTYEGHRAYHIHGEGQSNEVLSAFYPIHDVVDSYLEVETLRPLRFEKHQREGHYRADEVVTFDYATATATFRSLLNGTVKTIPLPSQFQDLMSTLYWFRAQPIQVPQTITVNIYTDEKIYATQIHIKRLLPLELVKRGTFSCVLVEPTASFKGLLVKRGRIWAYLTTDATRLPLLVQATTPWGPMSALIDRDSLQRIPPLSSPPVLSH